MRFNKDIEEPRVARCCCPAMAAQDQSRRCSGLHRWCASPHSMACMVCEAYEPACRCACMLAANFGGCCDRKRGTQGEANSAKIYLPAGLLIGLIWCCIPFRVPTLPPLHLQILDRHPLRVAVGLVAGRIWQPEGLAGQVPLPGIGALG